MEERDVTIPAIDDLFRKEDCYCQEAVKQVAPTKTSAIFQTLPDNFEPLKRDIEKIIDDWASREHVPAWKTKDLKDHLNVVVYTWLKNQNTNS